MKKTFSLRYLLLISVSLSFGNLYAQSARSHVNKGVNLYDRGKYIDSEVEFKKGLEKSPNNFQANFNLGDSYYKQGKYDDAMKSYNAALSGANSNALKAKVYYNIGNALLKDQKIKESIGAYTDALKLNPTDKATKYNLSYALDMLKNPNQQNKNNKNNQNKNQQNKNDQKNNQNKDQNKNNQNHQNSQQNQNKNDQKNQQQNQSNQPQPDKISKEQAQAIFGALNNDEKDLQKQLRKMTGKPIKTDKDW